MSFGDRVADAWPPGVITILIGIGIALPLFAWREQNPTEAMGGLRFGMGGFWCGIVRMLYFMNKGRGERPLDEREKLAIRLLVFGAVLGLWTMTYMFDPIIDRPMLLYLVSTAIGLIEASILLYLFFVIELPAP